MFFIHALIEDCGEIVQPMVTVDTIGEPIVFASCINPLSVALTIAEESRLDVMEICDTFSEFMETKLANPAFGFDIKEIDVTTDMITEWIVKVTAPQIGVSYNDQDLLDMVVRKNNEAIHELFFRDIKAIQIILNPANTKGHTMTLAGDFRADSITLVNQMCEIFGDFVMVCFPVELMIGPTGHRINQFLCHVYNDVTSSYTRGMIMQGNICDKCGEFYTVFPNQIEFCCEI